MELNRRVIVVDESGKRNVVNTIGMIGEAPVELQMGLMFLGNNIRPWRVRTDIPRAALDTIIAGVGYLL